MFFQKQRADAPNGLPGAAPRAPREPAQALGRPDPAIGEREIKKAVETLKKYKDGKANLESRVIEDEQWYKLRHWEVVRKKSEQPDPEPASAWLFNVLQNKHADAMDNYPEPNILPRERSDQPAAKALSSIVPVLLERNQYESIYSENWIEKLKHGTAPYGVFWNNDLENSLGDVDIRRLDLLNLFWEPGVQDIQKSRHFFITDVQDQDVLEREYPVLKGKLGGGSISVAKYIYDDHVFVDDKAVVVDWYYKVRAPGGKTLLHYAKFVDETLLCASENDPAYEGVGWYAHGQYPVVFDTLFPEKGTPVGFGYVAVCKDPQLYIDKLSQNILKNSLMATKPRYFASAQAGINKEQFLDWNEPIVEVEGAIEDSRLRPIEVTPLDSIYVNVLQLKVEELKETSSNRDVSSGGVASGVTAAAAIAALQEAGNKTSRDMISASYRAYSQVIYLCIELIRQFYDEARCFRITGQTPGEYDFIEFSNQTIKEQPIGMDGAGAPLVRRPVFDIKVKPQKRNPFSRMSQNELAKELYERGFFSPDRAQEALAALELMEFEGKDKVLERVLEGQTLLQINRQMAAQLDSMAALLQTLTGKDMGASQGAPPPADTLPPATPAPAPQTGQSAAMTPYGERLAKRARPDMDMAPSGATPGR